MSSRNLVDYIIVGGGAAGSALAHQLGVNRQNQVLMIDAGGSDRYRQPLVPASFAETPEGPRYGNQPARQVFGAGRVGQRHPGRIMDGSTTVNGMIWGRGGEADYQAWEAAGISGWNWSRFSEAFTAIERHALSATGCRDSDGRGPVETAHRSDAASELWIDALAHQGIDTVEDLHRLRERATCVPHPASTGIRTSAAHALLRAPTARANVRVRLHCTARRILFDGTTATGIEAETPRGPVRFTARREVILCAGTMESALLLERSGVGDPELLTAAGVHLVAANPAVGGNLRQRRGAVLTLRLNGGASPRREPVTPAARLWSRFRSVAGRPDAPAHGGTAVLAVMSSDRRASSPDMELLFTPLFGPDHDGTQSGATSPDRATVVFYLRSPTSIGSVHITGPTLKDPPRLVPGYLSTEHDKELTAAAFVRAREILATQPFTSAATETFPGPQVEEAADVLQYVLDHGFTQKHEVGTCALGPGGVVDDELRVHGTHRLRVADASVMPTLTTGDTEAASTAIGWIAGDILRNANTPSR